MNKNLATVVEKNFSRSRLKPDLCFCVESTPYPDVHLPKNITTHCSDADHKHCLVRLVTRISSYAVPASFFTLLLQTCPALANVDLAEKRLIEVVQKICAFVRLLVARLVWAG